LAGNAHPRTGASIEVFYVDPALETFGRRGGGWFWWSRRHGFPSRRLAYRPICYELCSISPRLGDRFGDWERTRPYFTN
jgi:hypothetical protein